MARLATSKELEVAATALHTLRTAVRNANMAKLGTDADTASRTLKKIYESTALAMLPLSGDPYNPVSVSAVQEFRRLEKTADDKIRFLNARAAYAGPRRGAMSLQDKSKFIAESGEEAYLKLPW